MKKHIPNTLTCCNLLAGCIATYFAFQSNFKWAFLFIVIGAVFDFFDGFAARLLHVSSPLGKELDSLADDITFGFAPATIVYSLLATLLNPAHCPQGFPLNDWVVTPYIPFVAFLIAAFSGLRLAKFNIDERQKMGFIGLPTPANALFWGATAIALDNSGWLVGEPWIAAVVIVGVFVSCALLVAEIPMFALKFESYRLQGNEVRYGFIICSVVLLCLLGWAGFSAVILLYVITSLVSNHFGTNIADEE